MITPTEGEYTMTVYADFFNDKGNVRPAARSLAKNDGFAIVKAALEAAGHTVLVDGQGSLYIQVGVANEQPIYFRLDNAITTSVR